ncbi:MAG: hypothetical protein ACYTEX_28315 [Planctomycetota bacterium]|jgi:hypothetical protein
MAREYVNCDNFDELWWTLGNSDTDITGYIGCAYGVGTDLGADFWTGQEVASKGGIAWGATKTYAQSDASAMLPALSKQYVGYSTMFVVDTIGTDSEEWAVLYSDYNLHSSAVGTVRIDIETDNTASPKAWRMCLSEKTGAPATFTQFGGWGAWIDEVPPVGGTPPAWKRLELQLDTTDDEARIIWDGADYSGGWQALAGTVNCSSQTSWAAGKITTNNKNSTIACRLQEYIIYADDDASLGLEADTYPLHVWGTSVGADVAGGDWSPTGNEAACSSDVWRAIDDLYDDADQANDYITCAAEAGDDDQLCEPNVTDLEDPAPGDEATVVGVAMTFIVQGAAKIDHGLMKLGATTEELNLIQGRAAGDTTMSTFMQDDPDGNSWEGGTDNFQRFEDCKFGVRMDTSNAGEVYGLCLHIIGYDLQLPTDATACPSAAARRISITHFDHPELFDPGGCSC